MFMELHQGHTLTQVYCVEELRPTVVAFIYCLCLILQFDLHSTWKLETYQSVFVA